MKKRIGIKLFLKMLVFLVVLLVIYLGGLAIYFKIPLETAAIQSLKRVLYPLTTFLYRDDLIFIRERYSQYRICFEEDSWEMGQEKWRNFLDTLSDYRVSHQDILSPSVEHIPFIYLSPNTNWLMEFKHRYQLDTIATTASSEYGKMLKIAAWVGGLWDHGTDRVPGGAKNFKTGPVVEAGKDGARFWCEIAARMMVHCATAMGWPARILTLSRDGYSWEHSVAEVWSNQFNKWIVLDTDFNYVYELDGIPLSGFELCRNSLELEGNPKYKTRKFAPLKPFLEDKDLLTYYRYIHFDLRNDWPDRILKRGSPAGNDRATWWTARSDFNPILTHKRQIETKELFNWKINNAGVIPAMIIKGPKGVQFKMDLFSYSPYFSCFAVQVNNVLSESRACNYSVPLTEDTTAVTVRVKDVMGNLGPPWQIMIYRKNMISE